MTPVKHNIQDALYFGKNVIRYLDSIAVDVPVKFQSDKNILTSDLAASRFHEIAR